MSVHRKKLKYVNKITHNTDNAGGNKKSGSPFRVGMSYQYNKRSAYRKSIANSNLVFCMNQLGGVGKMRSQFVTTADDVKDCVPGEYKAKIKSNLNPPPEPSNQCYRVSIENFTQASITVNAIECNNNCNGLNNSNTFKLCPTQGIILCIKKLAINNNI